MMWWPYDVMVLWWCGLRVLCCGGSYVVVGLMMWWSYDVVVL